jgi:Plant ATP synthase F0
MAQLDFFSYPDQYFLVSTTFWVFYLGSMLLFIIPFVQVMKMRNFISKDICHDEILTENFFKGDKKMVLAMKSPHFFL